MTPQQPPLPHPNRERLPTDRRAVTHQFKINGHKAYMIVGFYPDGRPGELFVTLGKDGSTMAGMMKTISILTSICLQHGITTEYLRSKFEGMKFEPSGITVNPEIPEAASFPDYIFRWIDLELKKPKPTNENDQAHRSSPDSER